MAEILPFQGTHYNMASIGDLNTVITPPYDNIPAGEDQKYRKRSPYNFAHVDLPQRENDDYATAKATLAKWVQHKILVSDHAPSFYWYRQTFHHGGGAHQREALVGAVQLTDFSTGVIRPHENTHGQAKKDRLLSLRGTGYNLSHIFGMVKDPEGFLTSQVEEGAFRAPLLKGVTEDGAEHTIWKLSPDRTPAIQAFFKDLPLYIVDGHHRYESALTYARETAVEGNLSAPAATTLFTICNAFDRALVVLPTHRGIKTLGSQKSKLGSIRERFVLAPVGEDALTTFPAQSTNTPTFLVGFEDELYACTPKNWEDEALAESALARLPMHWSDRKLLGELFEIPESDFSERIQYEKDATKLWAERSKYDLMVFHAKPKVSDVTDIADAREFMPPKSTYFYPKLASGLIMRRL